jgi:hypothetical protein
VRKTTRRDSLTFGVDLTDVGRSFDGVQMDGKSSSQGASIFSDPANLVRLGVDLAGKHNLLDASVQQRRHFNLWSVNSRSSTTAITTTASTSSLLRASQARKYLQTLEDAKLKLLSTTHLSSPGTRASELVTQHLIHTPNNQSSLVVTSRRLAVRTEVNKTGARTIFRFVSPSLAPFFVVLFAVVHPFALILHNFLHEHAPSEDDHRDSLRTLLWTTSTGRAIKAEEARRAIQDVFSDSGSLSGISVQGFRHGEVYIARQVAHLVHSGPNTHHLALLSSAQQRGHSLRTDQSVYGNVDSSGAVHELGAGGETGGSMQVVSLWQMVVGVEPVRLSVASGLRFGSVCPPLVLTSLHPL